MRASVAQDCWSGADATSPPTAADHASDCCRVHMKNIFFASKTNALFKKKSKCCITLVFTNSLFLSFQSCTIRVHFNQLKQICKQHTTEKSPYNNHQPWDGFCNLIINQFVNIH